MALKNDDRLAAVRERTWFYEFELPDGSRTQTDLPSELLEIHSSRRDTLLDVIEKYVDPESRASAIDFASHEGYFSLNLAKHFKNVTGLEIRTDSIEAARAMAEVVGADNVSYRLVDLQKLAFDNDIEPADFVLVYGLLYHMESPIHVLRLASHLSKSHILIETQISTFDISGKIEDGHYRWQRNIEGVFTLAADYSHAREGGSTDIALIPSMSALVFLLRHFGFKTIEVLQPKATDYEQFTRGSRVIVYGRK